jgi:preprotein translocase subunit SecG
MVITVFHIILTLILITTVLLQSGKQVGLSGSIAGGAETFFGKNKGRSMDGMLSKLTTIVAVLFILTSIVLAMI